APPRPLWPSPPGPAAQEETMPVPRVPDRRPPLRSPALALIALLLAAAPAAAQQSPVVTDAELDAALADRSADLAARRAAVQATLARPEVAAIAARIGVGVEQARAAAGSLAGPELERAEGLSRAIEQSLAGGQVLSINATTLIIILLLVILVVLIAD